MDALAVQTWVGVSSPGQWLSAAQVFRLRVPPVLEVALGRLWRRTFREGLVVLRAVLRRFSSSSRFTGSMSDSWILDGGGSTTCAAVSSIPGDPQDYVIELNGSGDDVDMSLRADSPADSALPPSDRCSPDNHKGGSSDGEERFECDVEEEEEDCGVMDVGKPSLSSDSFRSTSSTGSGGSGGRHRGPQRNTWLRTSLRRSGSGKRVSSGSLARELFQPSRAASGGRSGSFEAEDLQALSDHQRCVDDLSDKVLQLQGQVSALSDSLSSNDTLYRRVKQENASLVDRIHGLEEQIRELEIKSEERIHEEEKRLKEALGRQEREKGAELERYAARVQALESEQHQLREEVLRLRALSERLKQEKAQAVEQLEQAQSELDSLREEQGRLQALVRREREDGMQQRTLQAQLMQEMGRELEELRRLRTDPEGRPRSPSLMDLLPVRCRDLERQLNAVRDENKALREANEELQAQLLSSRVEEGRVLVDGVAGPASLAAEFHTLGTLSKEELIESVKVAKEENARLSSYIDNILLNILEHHPQLLEVKGMP